MDRAKRSARSQAALDFMISYGVAIIIVAIAMYVVLRLGVFSGTVAQPTCIASPSFSCGDLAYSHNGMITMVLTQATGAQINITGIACATASNTTGNGPQFGNVGVLPYSADPLDYPNAALANGLTMYSGATATIQIDCYNGGGVAAQRVGNPALGYMWINYTYGGLPSTVHNLLRVVQFTTKAS